MHVAIYVDVVDVEVNYYSIDEPVLEIVSVKSIEINVIMDEAKNCSVHPYI